MNIIFCNVDGFPKSSQCFEIKNEHLWKTIFEKLAFLAESGKDVKYYQQYYDYEDEKNGKTD